MAEHNQTVLLVGAHEELAGLPKKFAELPDSALIRWGVREVKERDRLIPYTVRTIIVGPHIASVFHANRRGKTGNADVRTPPTWEKTLEMLEARIQQSGGAPSPDHSPPLVSMSEFIRTRADFAGKDAEALRAHREALLEQAQEGGVRFTIEASFNQLFSNAHTEWRRAHEAQEKSRMMEGAGDPSAGTLSSADVPRAAESDAESCPPGAAPSHREEGGDGTVTGIPPHADPGDDAARILRNARQSFELSTRAVEVLLGRHDAIGKEIERLRLENETLKRELEEFRERAARSEAKVTQLKRTLEET